VGERGREKTKRNSGETTNGARGSRDRWRTPMREKEREREGELTTCLRFSWRGQIPRAFPYSRPYLPYLPTFSRPRRRHPLSRFLSLTLFLSLPVCMVKYCIIVLTAGRKTAQPVVPARRVARIRAACTLLSRPRSTTCREISRHRVASRPVHLYFRCRRCRHRHRWTRVQARARLTPCSTPCRIIPRHR